MKNVFLALTFICLWVLNVQAQVTLKSKKVEENQVPEVVRTAYQSTIGFPVKSWEKHEGSAKNKTKLKYVAIYESLDPASGTMVITRARYRADGGYVSQTAYFKAEEIPANITESAKKAYNGMQIKRGEKISIGKGGKTFFRVILRKEKAQKAIFICDLDGKAIEKEKIPAEINETEDID